jgi:VanZ family protein
VLRISLLDRLAKVVFFAALAFTFYSAVIPPKQAVQLVPWDKAEHFIAFYGLTGLAAAAFPKRNVIVIAVLLSGFGAFIEFVQGLPMVNRDRDIWDWVADTIAIVAALSPMVLVWWRGIARSALAAPRGTPPGGWPPGQKNIDM